MKLKNLKIYLLAIFAIFLFGFKTKAITTINLDNPTPRSSDFFKNKENVIQELLAQPQLDSTTKPLLEEINKNINNYTISCSQEIRYILGLPNKLIYTVDFTPSSDSDSNTTLSNLTNPLLTVNFNYKITNTTSIDLNNNILEEKIRLSIIENLESLVLNYSHTVTPYPRKFQKNPSYTVNQVLTLQTTFKTIAFNLQIPINPQEWLGLAKKETESVTNRIHYLLFVFKDGNYYLYDLNILPQNTKN